MGLVLGTGSEVKVATATTAVSAKRRQKGSTPKVKTTDAIVAEAEVLDFHRSVRRMIRCEVLLSKARSLMRLMTTDEMALVIKAEEYFSKYGYLPSSFRYGMKVLYERHMEQA